MPEGRFRLDDFELYQLAREFRKSVYVLVKQLPAVGRYCLGQQMRRAAISITNNIAEGHGRWHYQDNVRFCMFARGSISEVIDDFNVCLDEAYGDKAIINDLKSNAYVLIARLNSYIAYLRRGHAQKEA